MFVNLHVHTPGSFLDGMCRPKRLAKHLNNIGQTACAITDHGNMYGVIPFYKTLTNPPVNNDTKELEYQPIKPIIGMEAYIAPDITVREKTKLAHLLLLARTNEGYKNLIKLASKAHVEGFFHKPRLDINCFTKETCAGIIATSACIADKSQWH